MKKQYLKSFTILSLFSMALVSCSGEIGKLTSREISSKIDFEYWSTYSTTKVLQNTRENESRYDHLGKQINIQMMVGETEGSQLIITPSGNKSAYVDLDTFDLTNTNGDKIEKEKISVYFQKYIKLSTTSNQNANYKLNDMVPDMLLPLEKAIEYKENIVTGGQNQGLTIEVDSTNVAPGTYSGTFVLHVGDDVKNIPITVTVWPFSLNHKSYFQSSFLLYRNELIVGEYDNSDEMVKAYENKMLDYKINPYLIQNVDNNTVDYVLNYAKENFDNKNFNSIILPYDFATGYSSTDGGRAVSYIVELAKASTPEKPYLDYAYFYPGGFDEADLDVYYKSPMAENFFKPGGELDKTLDNAIIALNDYLIKCDPIWAEHLRETIRNIPTVFTNVDFKDNWVGSLHATFCPYMSLYQDTRVTQRYQDAAKNMSNGDLWAYTCSGPVAPWATFHIDDDNINMRVNGWIDKKIGLTGYLYYEVDKYSKFSGGSNNEDVLVDLYNDPLRYESINGDGYLFYPGRKYGINGPIATNRLTAYRDSMEDLDMLTILEERINTLLDYYDIDELNFEEYVGDLYDSLFLGATPKTTEENFYAIRNELAKRIIDSNNQDNLLVYQTRENGKCYNNIYVKNNSLEINGNDVTDNLIISGDGYCYKEENSGVSNTYSIKTNGNTYSRKIKGAKALSNFASSISNVVASTESAKTITLNGNKIDVTIISENKSRFKPYIGISSENIGQFDELYIEYTNNDDKAIDNLTINLYKNSYGNMYICSNTCPGHETRTLRINVKSLTEHQLSLANEFRLIFDNEYMDSEGVMHLLEDRHISFDNVYGIKK